MKLAIVIQLAEPNLFRAAEQGIDAQLHDDLDHPQAQSADNSNHRIHDHTSDERHKCDESI